MIETVFRSGLRSDLSPADLEAYQAEVVAVERLTVVRFASREAPARWARDPVHRAAHAPAKQRHCACYRRPRAALDADGVT